MRATWRRIYRRPGEDVVLEEKTESSTGSSPTPLGSGNRPTAHPRRIRDPPPGPRPATTMTSAISFVRHRRVARQPPPATPRTAPMGRRDRAAAVPAMRGVERPSPRITSGEPEPGRDTAAPASATTSASGLDGGRRDAFNARRRERHALGFNAWSRFYPVFRYQAKAPASERPRLEDGTAHETVKPLGLISAGRCRLV